jgi:hypothetical protein
MSGRGQRERAHHVDAAAWRDRVVADVTTDAGRAAAREHQVAPARIITAAELIGGYIAAGETFVSREDLRRGWAFANRADLLLSERQMRRLMRFLVARGHIERGAGDLIRPIHEDDLFRSPAPTVAVDTWFQRLSEPVRPLTSEDVDKMRRDERHQAKVDQAGQARAARDRAKQELLAVIRQEMSTGDPVTKRLLERVNKRLLSLGRRQITRSTLHRRLKEL